MAKTRAPAPVRRAPPRAAKAPKRLAFAHPPPRNVTTDSNARLTRSMSAYIQPDLADNDEADYQSSEDDRPLVLALSSPSLKRLRSSRQFAPTPKRRRRHRHLRHASRTEDKDELGHEDDAYLSPPSNEDPPRRRTSRATMVPARRKQLHVLVKNEGNQHRAQAKGFLPPPDEVIPPWHTLPYLILVQILSYASSPLQDEISVRWLAGAAGVCRAFAEPAATALYKAPPLLTMNRVYRLTELLDQPPGSTMFNYRQKVESLMIDIGMVAIKAQELKNLVVNCPRLTGLDIRHYKDSSPYRQLDENLRWVYSSSLFEGLGYSGTGAEPSEISTPIRLRSWRWSERLMGRDWSLQEAKVIHSSPAFSSLRKVTFVNYQRPSLRAKDAEDPQVIADDKTYAEVFAGVLDTLPNMTHLVMESSTAANEILLPLLPKTIQNLELINCWDVSAEHFSEYLVSHGRELRHLALHHNQSLSLAFLPYLGISCPNLMSLQMNLTYYSHHEFYNDSNPMYEILLLPDQVPSWPPTIQVIELEQLRQWGIEAAEMFFQSLIDSAEQLPMLRHLAIKAMLDIPWRQRSEMRDKWEARLKAVFRRESGDPQPVHSLRAAIFGGDKPSASRKDVSSSKKTASRRESRRASRRSGRIATRVSGPSSRASSIARGLRKAGSGRITYREPDSDEDVDDDAESDDSGEADGDSVSPPQSVPELFVQGLCDVVDIRFDNQKPMETQYGMDDFLDSDHANSDDEWTGDDDGADVSGYAW